MVELYAVEFTSERCPNGWRCQNTCNCHRLSDEALEADLAAHFEVPATYRPATPAEILEAARPHAEAARSHLAWLIWCWDQGYTNPKDRGLLSNWLLDDPATLTDEDRRERSRLLAAADEVLAALGADDGSCETCNGDGWQRYHHEGIGMMRDPCPSCALGADDE